MQLEQDSFRSFEDNKESLKITSVTFKPVGLDLTGFLSLCTECFK